MQTAVHDLNPNFNSGLLAEQLRAQDLEDNCYDMARGPCCDKKKWADGGDTQVFVSVDDLPSNYRDASDLNDEVGDDGVDFDTVDESVWMDEETSTENQRTDRNLPTDQWGVELPRPARSARATKRELLRMFTLAKSRPESEQIIVITDENEPEPFCLYGDIDDSDVLAEESLPSVEGVLRTVVRNYNPLARIYSSAWRGISHGWHGRHKRSVSDIVRVRVDVTA